MNFKNIMKSIALLTTIAYSVKAKTESNLESKCEHIDRVLTIRGGEPTEICDSINSNDDIFDLEVFNNCFNEGDINFILYSAPNVQILNFLKGNKKVCHDYIPLPNSISKLNQLDQIGFYHMPNLTAKDIAKLPRHISKLTLGKTVIDQLMINEICRLTNLKELHIFEVEFKDSWRLNLIKLRTLKNLKFFVSDNRGIVSYTDNDKPMTFPKNFFSNLIHLESLTLRNCILSKENYEDIQNLTLKQLSFMKSKLEDGTELNSIVYGKPNKTTSFIKYATTDVYEPTSTINIEETSFLFEISEPTINFEMDDDEPTQSPERNELGEKANVEYSDDGNIEDELLEADSFFESGDESLTTTIPN